MNVSYKYKVLWCDRNIHRASLMDILSPLDNIEITGFETVENAIAAFKRDNSYRLIISGNFFDQDANGIEFYKRLNLISSLHQFLLFTSDDIPNDHPFLILDNFNYFHKDSYAPEVFEKLVLGLIDRTLYSEDTHIKLAAIRSHLGYSEGHFAGLLNVTKEKVIKYETTNDVPSCYVLAVCNKLKIPLDFFSTVSLTSFIDRLDSTLKKDVV